MKELSTTCGELLGAALVSYGAWLAWPPLGFMLLGILLIGICWLVAE